MAKKTRTIVVVRDSRTGRFEPPREAARQRRPQSEDIKTISEYAASLADIIKAVDAFLQRIA